MITIHFTNQQKHLSINKSLITKVFKSILNKSRHNNCSISLVFVDNKEIRKINRRFLRCDNVTDVISFPLDDVSDSLLGEIVVSAEEALRQAKARKILPKEEIILYCIHGLLHLLGYDDTTPRRRKIMWKKQADILVRNGISGFDMSYNE